MTSPREKYDAARRRAQARRPADPQATAGGAGGPAAVASVANLMRPCATEVPGGTCGHPGYEHDTRRNSRQQWVRTACSIATAAGPCGCRAYTAPGETVTL